MAKDIVDKIENLVGTTPICDDYQDYLKAIRIVQDRRQLTDNDIYNRAADILLKIDQAKLSEEIREAYISVLCMLKGKNQENK